tara:strand:+ start:35910 stop:36437 length:528 start_codon:yes stop_codon:yes gene_type:complete
VCIPGVSLLAPLKKGLVMNIFKEHVKYNTEVYSLDHGDGEIINYLNLYDGLDDYFEVKYKKNGDSVLYSTKSYDRIRIESSLSVLSEALLVLAEKINSAQFEFEYNSYSRMHSHFDIGLVVNVIAGFMNKTDLNSDEEEIFSLCLNSLILEVSNVYNVSVVNARGIIGDHLRISA